MALSLRPGEGASIAPPARWLYRAWRRAFAANTARLAIVGANPMLLVGRGPPGGTCQQRPIRSPISRRWEDRRISTPTGTSSPIRAVLGEAGF